MRDDDLDDVATLLGDPEVMRFYSRPKARDEAQAWIERNRRRYREDGFGLWHVARTDTGEFVGDCGLTVQRVDGVNEVEIGYHLLPAHQGQGLATEAAAACRDLARDRFGVRRLIAIIDPSNEPSQAVARRIGLAPEKQAEVFGRRQEIFAMQLRPT
jgi:RimJ/RimL family protein N-acetyltransferase